MSLKNKKDRRIETVKTAVRKGNSKERIRDEYDASKRMDISRTVNRIKEGKGIKIDLENKEASRKNRIKRENTGFVVRGAEREKDKGNAVKNENKGVIWSQVVGRKAKITDEQRKKDGRGGVGNTTRGMTTTAKYPRTTIKKREPKTAAVIVNCAPGRGEEVMREARRKISLQELGIEDGMKCRRAITGATLFEIQGEEREKNARNLEKKLRETFMGREEVKVYRPTKMVEIKITDMEEYMTGGEIMEAVTRIGGCGFTEIKVNGIKVNGNDLATAWVKCPVMAANKIMEEGHKIGWMKAKAMILRARPLQCHRCLQFGHVQQYCRGKADNRNKCYHCGQEGHKAAKCWARVPRCLACEENCRNSGHRMGGPLCGEAKKEDGDHP